MSDAYTLRLAYHAGDVHGGVFLGRKRTRLGCHSRIDLGDIGVCDGAHAEYADAQKAGEAADLASSLNISAFNIGNALGSALGGAAIQTGFALRGAPAAGAAISTIGLVLLSVIVMIDRRSTA
nr:hypothetical protein [Paenibacillus cisolokensis]